MSVSFNPPSLADKQNICPKFTVLFTPVPNDSGKIMEMQPQFPKSLCHTRQNDLPISRYKRQIQDTDQRHSAGWCLVDIHICVGQIFWNIHRRTKMWFPETYQTPTKSTIRSESFMFWLLAMINLPLSRKDFLLYIFTHHSSLSPSFSGWLHPSFHL